MMATRVSEIFRLEQARDLLAQIKAPATTARIARQVIALLDQEMADRQQPISFLHDAKRGAARVEYRVERTGLGENVAEYRPGSKAKPFRCPRPLYEAIVAVLDNADGPLSMAEIVEQVARQTGQPPGDHQYRPAIRLWMHVQPPLLRRSRSRYSPSDGQSFKASASKLWHDLKGAREVDDKA